MSWNMNTKEPLTVKNAYDEPYEVPYPVAIFEGNNYDYLADLLWRIEAGETVGTELDLDWISAILKYGMLTCCNGRHVNDRLESLGYEKKGGGK